MQEMERVKEYTKKKDSFKPVQRALFLGFPQQSVSGGGFLCSGTNTQAF